MWVPKQTNKQTNKQKYALNIKQIHCFLKHLHRRFRDRLFCQSAAVAVDICSDLPRLGCVCVGGVRQSEDHTAGNQDRCIQTDTHLYSRMHSLIVLSIPTFVLSISRTLSNRSWLPCWLLNPHTDRCRLPFLTSSLTRHAHLFLWLHDYWNFPLPC